MLMVEEIHPQEWFGARLKHLHCIHRELESKCHLLNEAMIHTPSVEGALASELAPDTSIHT